MPITLYKAKERIDYYYLQSNLYDREYLITNLTEEEFKEFDNVCLKFFDWQIKLAELYNDLHPIENRKG